MITTVYLEVCRDRTLQVHGICALNVALVLIDQELIHTKNQQKYREDISISNIKLSTIATYIKVEHHLNN